MVFIFLVGYVTASQWSSAVESVLKLDVPWNMLRHQLAHVLPDGRVDYVSSLDQYVIEAGQHKVHICVCRVSGCVGDTSFQIDPIRMWCLPTFSFSMFVIQIVTLHVHSMRVLQSCIVKQRCIQ